MKELELQCKLLAAAIMHPGFRTDGEIRLRRALPQMFQKLATTAEGAMTQQGSAVLFGRDPRFTVATQEQYDALNTETVKKLVSPFLKDGAMEVTIVGDFKVEEALPVLERTFGAMPRRAAEFAPVPEEARRVDFQPWGQYRFLRYATDLDKTIVAQVYPAGDGRDMHRNRRLAVLASIARERLFDAIRAELGESYSPSMRAEVREGFRDAATMTAVSLGVKGNREKVNAAMSLVLASLGRGEITEDEFQQALRPYVARADKEFRQTGFWARSLARLQSDARQLGLLRDLREDARSISLEEIRGLAKEIFGDDSKGTRLFTVPMDYRPQEGDGSGAPKPEAAPAPEEPEAEAAQPEAEASAAEASAAEASAPAAAEEKPAAGKESAALTEPYAIVMTKETAGQPEWAAVAATLAAKHAGARVLQVEALTQDACVAALRQVSARYAAYVLRPEEVTREHVNAFHRAARRVDEDPWGDCLWGIVTGATPADAQRVAAAKEPLVLKRLLATTNVSGAAFEHSYCITDWTGFPVLEQSGYQEPTKHEWSSETEEGREVIAQGVQGHFAEQLATQKPQLIVTSSHATQFNVEMPFSKGLVFPAHGKLHLLTAPQMPGFGGPLGRAVEGDPKALDALADELGSPAIEPDGEPRVWLAAGNCLFGDAHGSASSMVMTALSAYSCNQAVGYTVPSWYGKGGWGTLSMFMENTQGTSLAEAWFLNNQFILNETMALDGKLLEVEFDDAEMGPKFWSTILRSGAKVSQANVHDALGLVHDRDTVAFYGDPAWRASVDGSHSPRPLSVSWQGEKVFTITANSDHKGRAAVWFPTAATGAGATGCDAPGAVFTNDFILFPALELKKGESLEVHVK